MNLQDLMGEVIALSSDEQLKLAEMIWMSDLPRASPARRCPVHGEELEEDAVPVAYGLICHTARRARARHNEFPYSFKNVEGGCCEHEASPKRLEVLFCPKCRQAEEAWQYDPLARFDGVADRELARLEFATAGHLIEVN